MLVMYCIAGNSFNNIEEMLSDTLVLNPELDSDAKRIRKGEARSRHPLHYMVGIRSFILSTSCHVITCLLVSA